MPELHDLSALEQAAAVRRREVSPSELVDHCLARIDKLGSTVGAFVTVTPERAMETARQAEARLRGTDELPLLFGVPTAIKDLVSTAGVRTTSGSAAWANFVPAVDDHVVARLGQAGLVSLGKTNTPEFGLACYTEPEVAPPARTPFDLSRSAGGSSGGAAAAVAAGLVTVAQASDGAGSIRIPASVCGAVGLKTSRGRVSLGPTRADPAGISVYGPIARTVSDAAAFLDVIAGPMPGDPYWASPLPEGATFLDAVRRPVGRLTIGMHRVPVFPKAEVHPSCILAFDEAAALLADLGHNVVDCQPAFNDDILGIFDRIWMAGAVNRSVPEGREGDLLPLTRYFREQGRALSGAQVMAALSAAQVAGRQAVVSWSAYDAVLTPTLAQPPALIGAFRDDEHPERDYEAQFLWTPFTFPANITGQPAITLPLHWTTEGLPIGVQLIGRPSGEATLIALAAQLEEARPWRAHVPSIW
jgi:amidase